MMFYFDFSVEMEVFRWIYYPKERYMALEVMDLVMIDGRNWELFLILGCRIFDVLIYMFQIDFLKVVNDLFDGMELLENY